MAIQTIQMSSACTLEDNHWLIPNLTTAYGVGEEVGLTGPAYTVEIAFELTSLTNYTSARHLLTALGDFYLAIYRSALRGYYISTAGGNYVTLEGPTVSINTPYIVHLVVNESGGKLYINGALAAESVTAPIFEAAKNPLYIHSNNGTAAGHTTFAMKCYGIAFYNDALSIDEIVANIEAYKERFNLVI